MILLKLACFRTLACFVTLFLFFHVHSYGADDFPLPLHSDVRSPRILEQSVEIFQMGIEVETHGIKIQHTDEDDILVILQSPDGKWQLTSDTHDVRIDGTNWVNLECRTVGGLGEEEIKKYTRFTYKFMSEIKGTCDSFENGQWALDALKTENIWSGAVDWMLPVGRTVIFSTKKQNETTGAFEVIDFNVRPQLSFSFPLRYMLTIFKDLLARHQDSTTPRLLRINETLGKPLPTFGRQREEEKRKDITDFEGLSILHHFLKPKENSDIDGFCLLVLSYAYELFVLNQQPLSNPETGPKAFLKVVSRVPFSAMYEQLDEKEKAIFTGFCERIPRKFLERKIKPYRKDDPGSCYEVSTDKKGTVIKDVERITLEGWLGSIMRPIQRAGQPSPKDALSPPPYTDKEYSMGVVDAMAVPKKHSLIEARGYADIELNAVEAEAKIKISLDNLVQFIDGEIGVFFGLIEGKVGCED